MANKVMGSLMFNLSPILLVVFLAGCMTAADYRNTPTSQLCMSYLTNPSYNVNQPAREEALRERGENCAAYTGAAASRNQANAAFEQSLRDIAGQR